MLERPPIVSHSPPSKGGARGGWSHDRLSFPNNEPANSLLSKLLSQRDQLFHDLPPIVPSDVRLSITSLIEFIKSNKSITKEDLAVIVEAGNKLAKIGAIIKQLRETKGNLTMVRALHGGDLRELGLSREPIELKSGEFFLEGVDEIGDTMPSEEDLKNPTKGYAFDSVTHIFENKSLSEFTLKKDQLNEIGITDTKRQDSILEALEQADSNQPVFLFDPNELINEKKKQDSKPPDHITTKEILETMDDRGYRPATIKELLAYAKHQWNGTDSIDALGSSAERNGSSCIATLYGVSEGRKLDVDWFVFGWRFHGRILFIRKVSL